MPGMKLDFLKNPAQRVASGKSLPLKQVEAIVVYGRPEQRAKAVQKLLPSVYGLSLNKSTHHIIISVLDHCDNMARVQMLYHVRRKILDLCTSPVGNIVVQHLIEKLPTRQRKEIAEAFVLNAENDEFKRLCEHPFGNHVAQKLMEFPECAAVVAPNFVSFIPQLAVHPYGMRVVAKCVSSMEGGWQEAMKALFPGVPPDGEDALSKATSDSVDRGVKRLFSADNESLVLAALLQSPLVPAAVKDSICAHLGEYAGDYLDPATIAKIAAEKKNAKAAEEDSFALPDFGGATRQKLSQANPQDAADAPQHTHTYAALLEHGDDLERAELWTTLTQKKGIMFALVTHRLLVPIAIAAVKHCDGALKELSNLIFASTADGTEQGLSVVEVAKDPVRTLLLRAILEVDHEAISEEHKVQLAEAALELSQSPTGSPVLQQLLSADSSGRYAALMYTAIQAQIPELIHHVSASYLIQALLQSAADGDREKLVGSLLEAFSDLHKALAYPQGSRVMQKLLAYAPDAAVVKVVEDLIRGAESEAAEKALQSASDEDNKDDDNDAEERGAKVAGAAAEEKPLSVKAQREANRARHYDINSRAIVSYALHGQSCFVIQALLRETRSRQLTRERKLLINELKPHVFDLAVSPWSGRVVLDALLQAGSTQLAEAVKNVVFLRAEAWLSEVSADRKTRGSGVDPTLREILKRQREDLKAGTSSSAAEQSSHEGAGAPAKKHKKLYRSMKK